VTFAEVEAFVRASLPPPPARVLEVGAGEGELARSLAGSGYDVTAIDPRSDAPNVRQVALLELDPEERFDAAVAVVSLHHVEPLEDSVERLASVLEGGAPVVIDEFDVGRLDGAAAGWWLEQRRARGEPEAESPAELIETMRGKVHALEWMRAALAPRFELGAPVYGTYLYRWKLDESLRPAEQALVARGALPATGVRFTAIRRAPSRRAASPRRGRRRPGPSRT